MIALFCSSLYLSRCSVPAKSTFAEISGLLNVVPFTITGRNPEAACFSRFSSPVASILLINSSMSDSEYIPRQPKLGSLLSFNLTIRLPSIPLSSSDMRFLPMGKGKSEISLSTSFSSCMHLLKRNQGI